MEIESLNSQNWEMSAPADLDAILAVEAILGVVLPEAYKKFLQAHDGGEGSAPDHYVIFWKVAELIELNRDYQVADYAPGIFLFGSNGGGEGYGFDTRDREWPVVMLPFIGMSLTDALPAAPDFSGFLCALAKGESAKDRQKASLPNGMELFDIKPVLLGGDPSDPSNRIWLTRRQHIEAVRYWNRIVAELRAVGANG